MSEEKNKNITREFGLTTFAVNNRTSVFVLTAIILFSGIMAYMGMPKESFPEIKLPTIYVATPYPGNSPENIEKLVTRPIEKELNEISGVTKITSSSLQDYSSIVVEFNTDMVVEEALQEVKDAIDRSMAELPTDLDQDPQAKEINFGEFPIMFIYLSGNYSNNELKEIAEYYKDEIEDLDEISSVAIRGVEEKEVKVDLDVHKLTSLKLSFQDVANAISGRNVTMTAGNAKTNGVITSIKIDGEFKDVSEIEDIIVKHENEQVVYLRELLAAPVVLESKEKESFARLEGKNVIMLDVIKDSGKNLLSASDKINDIIHRSQHEEKAVPDDLTVTISIDQSDQTRSQVANLENSIISGVILVVLVLLFFLGTRNSLFVGIAIPLSMLLSFLILSAMGVTINMMVLFGLIMALGMLVDNGIVVVENVYRLMDEGYTPMQAAKEGVGEIAWPIISSTATTLAAFLPLAMWPGIMGQFMYFLPLTLIVVLSSSLFVALVINPVLASVFMKVESEEFDKKRILMWCAGLIVLGLLFIIPSLSIANIFFFSALLLLLNVYVLTPLSERFQTNFLPRLENWYEGVLSKAMIHRRPIIIFFGSFGLLILSFVLFGIFTPKVLFFPENEPNYVNVFVEMPLGTDIDVTNEVTLDLEKQVNEIVKPYRGAIKMVSAAVGSGTSDPGDPNAAASNSTSTPHKARIQIEFVKYEDRDTINTANVMTAIRKGISKDHFPDATIIVDKDANGPPTGKPINIEISGEEYDVIIAETEKIRSIINHSSIRGIEELKTDLEQGKPEKTIVIDNAKAERLSVSTYDVASTVRGALYGREVSKFKDGEDDYDVMVRLKQDERNDFNALMNQPITFRDPASGKIKQIPINSIAQMENSYSLGSIRRKNLDRVVTLYSNVVDGYNATEINMQIKELLKDHQMPHGYSFKFTGEQEEQAKEMSFLMSALAIAVFLILMIIVGQFNRVSAPIVIMFSVIFSTIGVFLGLVIFQMDFIIIMTMIGIISLAGIVVNNAIVLLDYTILLMDRKKADLNTEERLGKDDLIESIVKSGKTRLRPVLLTAITTVLGLIPLAIGFNIDFFGLFSSYSPDIYIGGENVLFWGPMSWTIIFGITFATFLTLIVVPVMFLGLERMKFYFYEKGFLYTMKAFGSWLSFRRYKFNA